MSKFLYIIVEIKKPEMTKNISTPMNPPGFNTGKKWNKTTDSTAIARNPSISGRYSKFLLMFKTHAFISIVIPLLLNFFNKIIWIYQV
ncbi:hypothetical protein JCM31447_12170 [Fluviispira sanaruensis]|uniref:Uncharacterized protein n=1 Tax=Fluviispira sanaruensis TaxID=2493639 RepID=A0A4P2VLD9_FLUSA|nr:hypothetical protein JCM31447_12170 [Fluviispira sanaruensis]